jgi:hypothetical protein
VVFAREPMRAILAVMRFRSLGERDEVLAVVMPGPDEEPLTTVKLEGLLYSPVVESRDAMASQEGSFCLAWRRWLES